MIITSGCGADGVAGCNGSCNSGIDSRAVPLTKAEVAGVSLLDSADVPFGLSLLDRRICFGELEASEARGVDLFSESLLAGDTGRSEGEECDPSFNLPLFPKDAKVAPRFDDDFLSGDMLRP